MPPKEKERRSHGSLPRKTSRSGFVPYAEKGQVTFCQVWEAGKLTFAHCSSPAKTSNAPAPPRTVRVSGASRKAGFGEGTPQQVSREEQNRRIADFGTVVETCSVTVADCPCLVLPYIERTGQGLRPAVGGLFSFRQYYSAEGLFYPLDGDFSKFLLP